MVSRAIRRRLTKVGQRLGVELLDVIRANAVLGYNVPGITAPGYGNLTLRGIAEHTQLAQRLASRVTPLLSNAANGITRRQVIVSNSGVKPRYRQRKLLHQIACRNSARSGPFNSPQRSFNGLSVNASVPQAAAQIVSTLLPQTRCQDRSPSTNDPYFPIYQSSLDYQTYLAGDATMLGKVNSIVYSPASMTMARAVLETVFTKPFLDALYNGTATYSNTGTFTFVSDDQKSPPNLLETAPRC